MKVIHLVGARPNFMKVAPLHKILNQKKGVDSLIVHSGQHYDRMMSEVFFEELDLPKPQYHLGVKEGTATQKVAKIMMKFEEVIEKEKPNLIVVVGDVDSTLAGALTASKVKTPLAHVESGLRSFDQLMPEEKNRIVIDHLSDFLFVSEKSGLDNLKNEGISDSKIHFVGNLMIDSLAAFQKKASTLKTLKEFGLEGKDYVLMTMHRPKNVDSKEMLLKVLQVIETISKYSMVIFPMHPRTEKSIERFNLKERFNKIGNLITSKPLGYLAFLNLMSHSTTVITDSGGIQEETTFLGIPCLTLRNSTERPSTVTIGTNTIVPDLNVDIVKEQFQTILQGSYKKGSIPELWDGKSAERVAEIILN